MDIKKRTLTTTEESVLKNDLLDVEVWVNGAIDGKVANCKKRMIAEWLPKLYADESVTQIPANEDEMIALVVARSDYLDRSERDNGHPSGEPADSWTVAQLQKYLSRNNVAYAEDDAKSALLTKAKAKYAE
jgi:hypothetical protein